MHNLPKNQEICYYFIMKKLIKYILILAILIIVAGGVYYYFFWGDTGLSPDQQEIVDSFGYPQRFVVSYLPWAESGSDYIVRHETWYYPYHQQSITFLGGDILSIDEIDDEIDKTGIMTYSDLKPEDFEFDMDYDAVAKAIGDKEIAKNEFMPEEFYGENLDSYISDHVLFAIESDHLTYFETVGIVEEEGGTE